MLDLEFAHFSDLGKVRDHNEDYLGYEPAATPLRARSHGWLFALADGVGGHERGEVASRAAVERVIEGFRAAPAGEPLTSLLVRLVQAANTHVYQLGRSARPGGAAMATTMVACALRYDRAVVAHAGDSRCYLIRGGRPSQLTRDHTLAQEQARLGILSAKEAAEAPNRHLLSRSLGADLFVNVDAAEHQVTPGDVLALCCDGLHHSVSGEDMADVVGSCSSLKTAARELVNLANHRDGSDNISVLLVRVRSVERVGMYRGRPYKLR